MGLQFRKGKVTLNYRDGKPNAYKLIQMSFPQVTYTQLVNECSKVCGVAPSQTRGVVEALISRMTMYMELGHGVRLGDFGSFRPTFNSKVADNEKDATLEKTLKTKKIQFYPGLAFRNMLDNLTITDGGDIKSVYKLQVDAAAEGEAGAEANV